MGTLNQYFTGIFHSVRDRQSSELRHNAVGEKDLWKPLEHYLFPGY